jgi:site-specific DNA-cytosine methylase
LGAPAAELCAVAAEIDRLLEEVDLRRVHHVELFGGCGGRALGALVADTAEWRRRIGEGATIRVTIVERDAACLALLRRNLPQAEAQKHTITEESPLPPDLAREVAEGARPFIISGGPPCQPFSNLGQLLGAQDARDGTPTFVAVIAAARPLLFEMENVLGLLEHPEVLADLVRAFAALRYYCRVEEIRWRASRPAAPSHQGLAAGIS